jgi:hypothetical protein
MTRTSRARRRLNVVELNPAPHETQKPPATDGEAPQPDNADPDMDAALAGMSALLRLALRLMKS